MRKNNKTIIGVLVVIILGFFLFIKSQEITPDMRANKGLEALCNSGNREYCLGSANMRVESSRLEKKNNGIESIPTKTNVVTTKQVTPTKVSNKNKALSETIKEIGFEIAPANQNNIVEISSSKNNTSKYEGMESWSNEDLENYQNHKNEENMISAYENQKENNMIDAYENSQY